MLVPLVKTAGDEFKDEVDNAISNGFNMPVFEPPPWKQIELLWNGIMKVTEQDYKARSVLEEKS